MFCKPCEQYSDDKSSSFISGCTTFRLESIKTHEKSSSHELACKKETILLMKENKQTVVCSYTGDIDSLANSQTLIDIPGCSNAVVAMDLSIRKLNKDNLQKLTVCFNSAYWIAKNELPFTLYPSLLDSQKINGVELALSYKTDIACRRYFCDT
ncbi:hypothetical protein DPMN_160735 [Dreissena polymorpha]|uniref:C17orf113 probable zinc finger domain-containing protein n=1 Tax=Dreissena polymorpha TaxID=45954 RepID=A0A9D4EMR6_DREPO|nr:hypothetical protein DPMN_160735 [Dreissena polymorpha]